MRRMVGAGRLIRLERCERGTYLIGELVWAVGVTAFAIGRRRYDSVVSRKPLGVSALLVLAWWPPINRVLLDAIAPSEPIMRPDQISDAHVALVLSERARPSSVQIFRSGQP